jgi:DNA polymerase
MLEREVGRGRERILLASKNDPSSKTLSLPGFEPVTPKPIPAFAPPPQPTVSFAPRGDLPDDLGTLARMVSECRQCGLCGTRTNTVFADGSTKAKLVFIGEAPGRDEDLRGLPFVGRAGQLLDKMIAAIDLRREDVYICNVLKCRPPENRNPLPHEIEQCSPYLVRQLEALQPRVICCLGKFAAELLVGVKGTIASLRGRVYAYRGSKLIVTYHPAACLRNPTYKRPVWEDMQLLAREYLSD